MVVKVESGSNPLKFCSFSGTVLVEVPEGEAIECAFPAPGQGKIMFMRHSCLCNLPEPIRIL